MELPAEAEKIDGMIKQVGGDRKEQTKGEKYAETLKMEKQLQGEKEAAMAGSCKCDGGSRSLTRRSTIDTQGRGTAGFKTVPRNLDSKKNPKRKQRDVAYKPRYTLVHGRV